MQWMCRFIAIHLPQQIRYILDIIHAYHLTDQVDSVIIFYGFAFTCRAI